MKAKAKQITDITDLTTDPRNANVGTERGSYVLDDSLSECGAGRSIVADRDGTVIAGNKTLQAAADRGFPVRVVQTDGEELVVVQRTDLDLGGDGEEQKRAQRLALYDNRAGQLGLEWDAEMMAGLLSDDEDVFEGLFQDWELAQLGIGDGEVADPDELWKGMPEFENNPKAIKTIHIHFKSEDDLDDFAQFIDQKITMNTRFIWYPKAERRDMKALVFTDES